MPGAPRGPRRSRHRAAIRRCARLRDTLCRRSGRASPPPRRRRTSPTRRRRRRGSRGGGCPGARTARRRSSAPPAQPRDAMRRDVVEEAFRNREAPQVLEAVQQPVGGSRVAARLELPQPDEPRHADVDRLLEQMLEVAPQPGRHPLGDAGLDPAFRVDERVGAEPLDRRRGRQDGPRATASLDEPPDQVLVRLRLRCFFVELFNEFTRGAARRTTGIRTGGAAPPDARAGSRTAPRSRRAPPRPGGAGGR